MKFYSFSTTTCFGASSSADVFHDLGSAAEFILRMAVTTVVICRYADDYIVFITPRGGAPDYAHAEGARARIISVCDALGLPIAKFEGPAPELVFIGSGIDTIRRRVFVPARGLTTPLTSSAHGCKSQKLTLTTSLSNKLKAQA